MWRKLRRLISRFGTFIFILTLIGFVLGCLSTVISPNTFWPLAYAGWLLPVFTLLIFAFLFYWALRRKKRAIYPLLALVLGWSFYSPLFGRSFKKNKGKKDTLKVMSYNVRNFELYEREKAEKQRDKIFELIKSEDPDIVCFQEFYHKPDGHTTVEMVAKKLGLKHRYMETSIRARKNQEFGLAIYSKYPIINEKKLDFNENGNLAMAADIEVKGDTVRLYNFHLASIRFDAEDYSYLDDLKEEGTKASDKNRSKVIARKMRDSYRFRATQADKVSKHIKKSPYKTIVCGDMNDVPVSYAYRTICRGLKDTFLKAGAGFGATHSRLLPILRIDYILVSPDVKTADHRIIRNEISDHYPIVAELILPEKKEE